MPRPREQSVRAVLRSAHIFLRDASPSDEARIIDRLLTSLLRRRLELFHVGNRRCQFCDSDRGVHVHLPGGTFEFLCEVHRPSASDFGNHADCEALRASRDLGDTLLDDDELDDPRAVTRLTAALEKGGGEVDSSEADEIKGEEEEGEEGDFTDQEIERLRPDGSFGSI